MSQPPIESAATELRYNIACRRLDVQLGSIDALDTKLAYSFATALALAALLLAAIAIRRPNDFETRWALAVLAGGFALIVWGLVVFGLAQRKWAEYPKAEAVARESANMATFPGWAAEKIEKAHRINEPVLNRKANALMYAEWALLGEAIFAAVALTVLAIG